MNFPVEIANVEYVVHYTYRVTAEAQRATGPTYSCGGTPAEPMEYEVTVTDLFTSPRKGEQPKSLKLPAWLRTDLEAYAQESDDVYLAIIEDHEYRKHPDPDEAYDRARDEEAERNLYSFPGDDP